MKEKRNTPENLGNPKKKTSLFQKFLKGDQSGTPGHLYDSELKYVKRPKITDSPPSQFDFDNREDQRNRLEKHQEGPDEFITDPELAEHIVAAITVLGQPATNEILKITSPLDGEATITHDDGTRKIERHFETKQVLTEIPSYVEVAQQVYENPARIEEVLIHTLTSASNKLEPNKVNLHLLTKGLHYAAEKEEKLSDDDLDQLKDMITSGGEQGALPNSLYAYGIARRVGLPHDSSTELVTDFLDSDFQLAAGYAMPHFTDALKTLTVAKADPELVRETFQSFSEVPRDERDDAYDVFKEAITFGYPTTKMTPEELLHTIKTHKESGGGNIKEILEKILDAGQQLPSAEQQTIHVPKKEREKYFIKKPGTLEHAALPYVTRRSLKGGVSDIEKLTFASSHQGDDVAEGNWVFDPKKDLWYSLGGKTVDRIDGAEHQSVRYDVSELSPNPLQFHIHPKEMASSPQTQLEAIFPSELDYTLTAKRIEQASNAMRPRSFISHPLGITEFTYPYNPETIQQMGEHAQEIFSFFMRELGSPRRGQDQYQFAQMAITAINTALSSREEGFGLKLHPHGTDLTKEL